MSYAISPGMTPEQVARIMSPDAKPAEPGIAPEDAQQDPDLVGERKRPRRAEKAPEAET